MHMFDIHFQSITEISMILYDLFGAYLFTHLVI